MKVKLFIILISILFTACASNEASNNANDDFAETESVSTTEIERPYIPADTNYDGYDFIILAPSYNYGYEGNDVYAGEENGDPLNDAVYRRNRMVESLLNIEINVSLPGDTNEVMQTAKKVVLAGSAEFDAIVTSNERQLDLVQAKCLENFYKIPNIDLTKNWWDQKSVDELSYKKSKLYYVCGDINYWDDYGMYCLLFNKHLFEEYDIEYPYEQVKRGEWTFDAFSTLIKDFGRDLNGDGIMNDQDLWGFADNQGGVWHFLGGFAEKAVTVNNAGEFVLNQGSERFIQSVLKSAELCMEKNNSFIQNHEYTIEVFRNGHALFHCGAVIFVRQFRDMENDFGIIPMPKYDLNQEEYRSFVNGTPALAYSVPTTNTDLKRTGMILEVMAGYSTDTITPAIIDVTLMSKFVRDEESAEMLPIIFSGKTYDFVTDYYWGNLYSIYCTVTVNGAGNFVSSLEREIAKVQVDMDKTIAILEEIN